MKNWRKAKVGPRKPGKPETKYVDFDPQTVFRYKNHQKGTYDFRNASFDASVVETNRVVQARTPDSCRQTQKKWACVSTSRPSTQQGAININFRMVGKQADIINRARFGGGIFKSFRYAWIQFWPLLEGTWLSSWQLCCHYRPAPDTKLWTLICLTFKSLIPFPSLYELSHFVIYYKMYNRTFNQPFVFVPRCTRLNVIFCFIYDCISYGFLMSMIC